jgi:hypothetical protein
MLHKWVGVLAAKIQVARQQFLEALGRSMLAMEKATTEPVLRGGRIEISRRQLIHWAAFYLGIPVAFALYAGAAESGSATFVAKRYYFLYFLATGLPSWWVMDLATRAIKRLLQPWGPSLVVILILGAILGSNIQGTWAPLRHALFEPYLVEGSHFYAVFPPRFGDPDYLIEALIAWTSSSVVWVSANLFFIHVLNFPRFGYRASPGHADQDDARSVPMTPPAQPTPALKVLLDKLPENVGNNIVALKAEEHYTRVYTDRGEALILMPFRDAVGMLGELDGMQTHRSYWVNNAYVAELVREGRSSHVHLKSDIDIPVSRSYRVKVQEALNARAVS